MAKNMTRRAFPRGGVRTRLPVTIYRRSSDEFSPAEIEGLALWLDASDSASVTLNGGNVSQWRDKSGGSRHFSQATSGAQPEYTSAGQNGKNCLTFDGSRRLVSDLASSNWSFLHDGVQPYSVFIVWKAASGAIRTLFSTGNSSQGVRSIYVWHDFGTLAANNVRSEVTTTSAGNYVIVRNMGSQTQNVMRWMRIDGDLNNATAANRLLMTNSEGATSTATTASAGNPANGAPQQNATIGSLSTTSQSFGFNGVICEVLMYSRSTALTASESSKIGTELTKKWGLA
jgi:hypothetical protein